MGCKGSRVQISALRPAKTRTSASPQISKDRWLHVWLHFVSGYRIDRPSAMRTRSARSQSQNSEVDRRSPADRRSIVCNGIELSTSISSGRRINYLRIAETSYAFIPIRLRARGRSVFQSRDRYARWRSASKGGARRSRSRVSRHTARSNARPLCALDSGGGYRRQIVPCWVD